MIGIADSLMIGTLVNKNIELIQMRFWLIWNINIFYKQINHNLISLIA